MQTSPRVILAYSILSALLLLAMALYGQEKPKTYTPTEIQLLKLQNKQKDAVIAKQHLDALQTAMTDAQKTFQQALKDLTDEAEKVKSEQHWPKETQFDPNNISFTEPAKETKK